HDAPQPLRQRLDELRTEKSQLDAEERVADAHGGERKGDRIAKEQDDDQRPEHQRGDVADEEGGHLLPSFFPSPLAPRTKPAATSSSPRAWRISSASSSSAVFSTCFSDGSGINPRRKATRLMSSETPCTRSNAKPIGTRTRAGQMRRPPALVEIS